MLWEGDVWHWRLASSVHPPPPYPPHIHTSHQAGIHVHRTRQCQRGLECLVNEKRRGKPRHANNRVHLPPQTICYLYLSPDHTHGMRTHLGCTVTTMYVALDPACWTGVFFCFIWTSGHLLNTVRICGSRSRRTRITLTRRKGWSFSLGLTQKLKKQGWDNECVHLLSPGSNALINRHPKYRQRRGETPLCGYVATAGKRHGCGIPTAYVLWHSINHWTGESKGQAFLRQVLESTARRK